MRLFSSLRKWLTGQSQTPRTPARKSNSTLTGNYALADVGRGGGSGIYNDGGMTLSGSTVSGNGLDGIFNDKHGHLMIEFGSNVVSNSVYDLYNLGVVKISTDSDVGVIVN
jgi:hypothetical protein